MSSRFKTFFRNLLLFSVLIAVITFIISPNLPEKYDFPHPWLLLLFFILTTAGLHYFLIRNPESKPQSFVRGFMGVTSLKLMVYLFIIVCYFLFMKETAAGFIIHFMFYYVAFSAFEVISLLGDLRKKK